MDAQTIVRTGLAALDDSGFDKLSMRGIASRLDVQVGGLYYYVPDKATLLRAMADVLCRDVLRALDDTTGQDVQHRGWADAAADLCEHLRTVLLARRDAARVLATAPLNASFGALELMERLLTVLDEGLPPDAATVAADALMSYVTGYALQQQAPPSTAAVDVADLQRRVPRVMRSAHVPEDVLFARSVRAILAGVAAG